MTNKEPLYPHIPKSRLPKAPAPQQKLTGEALRRYLAQTGEYRPTPAEAAYWKEKEKRRIII